MFNKIRAMLSYRNESFGKNKLSPWSKPALDNREAFIDDDRYFLTEKGKKALYLSYLNNWALNRSVKIRANLMSYRGMKIKCSTDKQKQVIKEFLSKKHPTRPMLALQQEFRQRCKDTDVFGWAADELLYDPAGTPKNPADPEKAKKLHGNTPVHPLIIDLKRTAGTEGELVEIDEKTNLPKGWTIKRGYMSSPLVLPFKRVAIFKYESMADEIFGESLLSSIFKSSERHMLVEEGFTQGVLKSGNPLKDVIVGDETHPPSKTMIDNTCDEVADLNNSSAYVHPPWIRMSQIESFSLPKAANYTDPFITAISAGTGVPKPFLLGTGEGTNKATITELKTFINQTIEPLQQAQAMYYEEEILAPLMKLNKIDDVPTIEFNEILPHDTESASNIIKNLADIKIEGKELMTHEEAREILQLGKHIDFKMEKKTKMTLNNAIFKPEQQGIIIPKKHAEMIVAGTKSIIIKDEEYSSLTGKPILLIAENKAYGFIKLRDSKKLNENKFEELAEYHQMTNKERAMLFKSQDLFGYELSKIKIFDFPKKVKIPEGLDVVQDVQFIN
jgi:hypothetical protein